MVLEGTKPRVANPRVGFGTGFGGPGGGSGGLVLVVLGLHPEWQTPEWVLVLVLAVLVVVLVVLAMVSS